MSLSEMMLGNAYDTDFTYRLHKILDKQRLEDYHGKAYQHIMKRAIPIFTEMGMNGVKVDRDRLSKVKQNLTTAISELEENLLKDYPDLNLNSSQQVMAVLFEKEFTYQVEVMKLKKYKNGKEKMVKRKEDRQAVGFDLDVEKDHLTDAGLPSTDKEAINAYIWQVTNKRVNKKAEEFLRDLKEYKRLAKLLSAFVTSIEVALENSGKDNVFFKYKLDGTVTGRLSCSMATRGRKKTDKLGVSFHTLPREKDELYNVRDSFVVDDYDTQVFVAADYSTMELRILAHFSQDPQMMKAFREGLDLHTYTASLVFNKPMEAVTEEERNRSKVINFSIVYGAGIKKIAYSCELTIEQTKFILERHKQVFAKAHAFLKSLEKYMKENKRVVSLFGRSRRLPDVVSRNEAIVHSCYRKGKNSIVQSSASDVLVCVTVEIYDFIQKYQIPNTRILANVHDSIELAVDKRIVDPFLVEMKKIMMKPKLLDVFGIEMSVPLKVDIEVGSSFGDVVKWKGAA